jgi:amidase
MARMSSETEPESRLPVTPLHYLEITELAGLLRTRELSPVDVTRSQLERIGRLDRELASFTELLAGPALADARAAEREIAAGHWRGPLHGVPIGVKDLFWVRGARAAAGTTIYRDFRPGYEATAVSRLRAAGAVILGKQQMSEGAYADHHPDVTPPRNPWDPALWPGISSSGPAVATAAGLGYASLGSDTGGSIRWPCAATGLTGIKPTWGRVSRDGAFALAPTMDHIGPIARSAADAAVLLTVIAGPDDHDRTTLPAPLPALRRAEDVTGMRIGIDPSWHAQDPQAARALDQALATLADRGATIAGIAAPDCAQAVRDWTPQCAVEAAVAHRETFPARRAEYGPVLTALLDSARQIPATQLHEIAMRRLQLRAAFDRLLAGVDLLACPVHPFAPLTLEDIQVLGERPELIHALQSYTAPFDLTGHPTITFPGPPTDAGLPVGLQLVAARQREDLLVRAATAFQAATDHHRRHPTLDGLPRVRRFAGQAAEECRPVRGRPGPVCSGPPLLDRDDAGLF